MKMDSLDRYVPLETALHELGFQVDDVEKQGKKTIITVSQQTPVFPGPAASPKEQANDPSKR
jgi:hypothetical protein